MNNMIEKTIKSLSEYINLLKEYDCGHHVYRGVPNTKFDLTNTISRSYTNDVKEKYIRWSVVNHINQYEAENITFKRYEDELISRFEKRITTDLSQVPKNRLQILALAQHHGLPTRLLDWSTYPLIALFFATKPIIVNEENLGEKLQEVFENHAAVYVMHACNHLSVTEIGEDFDNIPNGLGLFYSEHLSPRITAQGGLFSIQSNALKPLNEILPSENNGGWKLIKIIIPKESVKDIQTELFRIGIRHENLFPDFDGYTHGLRLSNIFNQSHTKSHTRCE